MDIDDILAGRHSPRVGDLIVEVGHVLSLAQIIPQQIEHSAALVRVADRRISGPLDPKIDVGIELVRPLNFDDDVSGSLYALRLARLGGRIHRRHHEDRHQDETAEHQQGGVEPHGEGFFIH